MPMPFSTTYIRFAPNSSFQQDDQDRQYQQSQGPKQSKKQQGKFFTNELDGLFFALLRPL
jgi:uncharacterized protein YaiI (UPF0178 family)